MTTTEREPSTEGDDSWTDLSDMANELKKHEHDHEAGYVHVNYVDHPVPTSTNGQVVPPPALDPDECAALFDADGRLVKEVVLRKSLFERGVHHDWRHKIWKFVFGIYPFNSTYREQRTIDLENRARYKALHERWVVLDRTISLPDEELTDPLEYLLSSDDEDDSETEEHEGVKMSRVYSLAERINHLDSSTIVPTTLQPSKTTPQTSDTPKPLTTPHTLATPTHYDVTSPDNCTLCNSDLEASDSSTSILDEEGVALLKILDFPSRVYATRQPVDLMKSYPKGKRVILRDVKRTDRTIHFFSHKRNLRKVHRILHIYAMYHPEVGYCQGMNDILARFLVITNSEVDSYWMFCHYMELKKSDFLEHTMMAKIALVKGLLQEIDEELFKFFDISECNDFLFCHRWLLLDFKREFTFIDSLRILEVLHSHYMELSSNRALKEVDIAAQEEFAAEGGEVRAAKATLNMDFTFDVFMCAAILTLHRGKVSASTDAASIYGYLNSLCMNMNMTEVLREAERLLLMYCRQSVTKGFSEVDI